jgi:hypothetical protein
MLVRPSKAKVPRTLSQEVTFLAYVREVPGSNLRPGLRDFVVFLSPFMPPEGKCHTSSGHDCFLPHPFPFIIDYSVIPFHLVRVSDSVVK